MKIEETIRLNSKYSKNYIQKMLFTKLKDCKYAPLSFDNIKILNVEEFDRVGYYVLLDIEAVYSAEVGTRRLETESHVVKYTDDKYRVHQKVVKDDVWKTYWKNVNGSKDKKYADLYFEDNFTKRNKKTSYENIERFKKILNDNEFCDVNNNENDEIPDDILKLTLDYGSNELSREVKPSGDQVRDYECKIRYSLDKSAKVLFPCCRIVYQYGGRNYESIYDENDLSELKYDEIQDKSTDNSIKANAKKDTHKYVTLKNTFLLIALLSFSIYLTDIQPTIKNTVVICAVLAFVIVLLIQRSHTNSSYEKFNKEIKKTREENFNKFIENNGLNNDDSIVDIKKESEPKTIVKEDTVENKLNEEKNNVKIQNKKLDTNNNEDVYYYGEYKLLNKKEIETYEKNGLIYHVFEAYDESGERLTFEIPEYNEVLAYYTFLNKYKVLKKPELIDEKDYSHWVFSQIGITNVSKLHKELFEKGFYDSATCKEILSTYKVGDIKNLGNKLNITLKGTKDELIDQLITNAENNKLKDLLADFIYCSISDYGYEWMNEHKAEYEYMLYGESVNNTEEEKLTEYEKEISEDDENFGYSAYISRSSHYKNNGEYKKAMIDIMTVLYIALSGAEMIKAAKVFKGSPDFSKKVRYISIFPPGIVKRIYELKDYYTDSMIIDVFNKELPINANTPEMFKSIMNDIVNDSLSKTKQNNYLRELKSNFNEVVKKYK